MITPVTAPDVGAGAAPPAEGALLATAVLAGGRIISEIQLIGTEYSTSIEVSLKYLGSPICLAPLINP